MGLKLISQYLFDGCWVGYGVVVPLIKQHGQAVYVVQALPKQQKLAQRYLAGGFKLFDGGRWHSADFFQCLTRQLLLLAQPLKVLGQLILQVGFSKQTDIHLRYNNIHKFQL